MIPSKKNWRLYKPSTPEIFVGVSARLRSEQNKGRTIYTDQQYNLISPKSHGSSRRKYQSVRLNISHNLNTLVKETVRKKQVLTPLVSLGDKSYEPIRDAQFRFDKRRSIRFGGPESSSLKTSLEFLKNYVCPAGRKRW